MYVQTYMPTLKGLHEKFLFKVKSLIMVNLFAKSSPCIRTILFFVLVKQNDYFLEKKKVEGLFIPSNIMRNFVIIFSTDEVMLNRIDLRELGH